MYHFLVLLSLLCLALPIYAQDTHQTVPSATSNTFNTVNQTFLKKESANRTAEATANMGWVTPDGGCLAVASATKVLAPFACEGYTSNGYYATQTSTGIDLGASPGPACGNDDLAWVILGDGVTAPGGNFTQVGTSKYYVDCATATQPATPSNATLLFLAHIVSSAVTKIVDLRSLAPTLPAQNFAHDSLTVPEEESAWRGDAAQPFKVLGATCTHPTSGTTTATIPDCRVYVRDVGPDKRLIYLREPGAATVTYNQGDGVYWVIMHASVAETIAGWTRVEASHYLWKLSPTYPAIPNKALFLMHVTVAGGAITAVDSTVAPSSPFVFDHTAYMIMFGMLCDGVTENTAAMVAAVNSLPTTGGNLKLPASRFPCKFNTTFAPTKPFALSGAGGEGTARFDSPVETMLEYTGTGVAIEMGALATGSVLQGFGLNNTGTGTVGIRVTGGNNHRIRGVSIVTPTVKFSVAGIEFAIDAGHSHTISETIIRDAAPDGFIARGGIATKIIDSAIHHHEVCNVAIGDNLSSPVKDFHIFHSRMELNTTHATSDAVALCTRNVEGLHATESHFELGVGAAAVLRIQATDTQCEQCFFQGNWISLLDHANLALHPTGVFVLDAPGTIPAMYLKVTNTRINDVRTSGNLLSMFNIGNTSTNGGAGNLIIEDNEIPLSAQLQLINDESLVNGSYRVGGNWQLGVPHFDHNLNINQCLQNAAVGNVGTGEDNLMVACTIAGRRLLNGGGFRATVFGVTGSNANLKTLNAYWNNVLVWTSGSVAANAVHWRIECNAVLANASSMYVSCQGNPLVATTITTSGAQVTTNFALSPVWQMKAIGVDNNDVVQRFQMVELTKR